LAWSSSVVGSGIVIGDDGAIYYHFNYETTLSALPALSLSALLFLTIKLAESVDRFVHLQPR